MSEDSSIKLDFKKHVVDLKGDKFAELMRSADIFICAAGFEARAERVPLTVTVTKNPIIVSFKNGPCQNEKAFKKFATKFKKVPGYDVCEIDLAHLEKFERDFENSLCQVRNFEARRVILDISALPTFAICIMIMKIRRVFPTTNLTLLYTEAEEYFPKKSDFDRIKRTTPRRLSGVSPEYLSARAVTTFMPTMFSGVTLGHNDTCLVVFAGYEPHRTNCVIEATNPSKLVMVYGEPERSDLKWRLELSKLMHAGIDNQLMKTEEVALSSSIADNLKLLLEYYECLYDDHVFCISPTNSKMQAVASALAWETYPDIQLNFPIPTEYLPKKFTVEARDTFAIDLGLPPVAQQFMHEK